MTSERRRALIGVNAGIFLAHIGNYIWFPVFVASLGGTDSGFWAGVVMCMTYVGRLAATFFYEGVAARIGVRGAVFAGTALEATALGAMGFVGGVAAYSALALFIGLGSGTAFPGLKNILVSYPDDERPKAFSTFQMAAQVGLLGGALIGGLFVDLNLRTLFSVVFAIFIGFCLASSAFIPRDGFTAATQSDGSATGTTGTTGSTGITPKPPLFSTAVFKGIEVRGATRYFLLSAVFWFLSIGFIVGIPLHMERYASGWAPSSPFWITGLVVLVLQYPLFKALIKRLEPGTVMAIGLVGMTLAFLAFGAGRGPGWVFAGCLVVVLGDILFVPSFDMWVARRVPEDRLAKAMGAMHFFRSAGNMAGSLLAGVLFDLSGSLDLPGLNWYVAAVIAAGCAVVCLSGRTAEESVKEEKIAAGIVAEG
ncbi:MFS transporter [Streptomyces acidiscabies]|uniref:MFS transporter n=1 Tax=Streptomyces acidiscabies TaxID=42234 RepID=A0AAP6B7S2_9ACTN|nr:MFS transporter [Streptomyces acidiscabies]MBP5939472.1 MFS transporter [Streptomyces sp. LBUM 1476]MBZ3910618.1 MFS transporter [Streptomyces acidiscabies]MDX2959618.1 MFS transporter [Streptomyces acidiscabies]MDX3019094.1 MFS transporter [Streptomyces acidiscabies]MDX3790825.1 MFS transporter [Streptomyces acidiscabies]